ncbi:hypothetical protein [Phormidium sp. CCY1219]|uniref:hypothetical protein n=1 Tax=Phormidium sp. CCY1219 TaxID=2886104 RepID=UPI002D1F0A12|nr:hypothetical protein [Phormidium sp. CCY1219]MEB3828119.1 hypothetical protein [Phormidium sp. CCY1219]
MAPNSENPHLKQIRLPLVGAGFGLWILAFPRLGLPIPNWRRVIFLPWNSGVGLIGTPTNLPGVAEDKSAVNLPLLELLWPRIALGGAIAIGRSGWGIQKYSGNSLPKKKREGKRLHSPSLPLWLLS